MLSQATDYFSEGTLPAGILEVNPQRLADNVVSLRRRISIFHTFSLENAIFVVSARFRKDFSRGFILLIAYLQGFEVS